MSGELNSFFGGILGLDGDWEVFEVRSPAESGDGAIHVSIRESRGRRACPCCGDLCPVYDHTGGRTWRNTDVASIPMYVHSSLPRTQCGRCGVHTQVPPWARKGSHFTLVMEALVRSLIQELPLATTASMLRMDPKAVARMAHAYAEELRDTLDLSGLRRVGVDERSMSHREFATVFHDMDTGLVVFATPGKDADTIAKFRDFLTEHRGRPGLITDFSTDFGSAYISGIGKYFKNAEITTDRFHLAQLANDAVSDTRCSTIGLAVNRLKAKYLLARNGEDLEPHEKEVLETVLKANPELTDAYALKEYLLSVYSLDTREMAETHLDYFVCAASKSKSGPMKSLAETVAKHRDRILNYFRTKLTNGRVEGVNNLLNRVKARCYGFHSMENFIDMIWITASRIRTDFYGKPRRYKRNS